MNFRKVRDLKGDFEKNIMLYFEGEVKPCTCISEENRKVLDGVVSKQEFSGKEGEKTHVTIIESGKLLNIILLGVGKREDYNSETLRKVLYKGLKDEKGDILITGDCDELLIVDAIGEVATYLNYNFDKYKQEKKDKVLNIHVYKETGEETGEEGIILGESVCLTRNLINEPANVMYPEALADITVDLGKKYGFEVEVKEEDEIESLGMESYLSVARAAEKRPRFIVMRYMGNPENPEDIIGVVGKGLTYDTGGLSIKPTTGMVDMKSDMGGAATIIGSITAAVRMGVKKNIVGVIAACENSIAGNAYRPGDIIGSMNGKTIEVTNTDAEGRLTLNDAITYTIRNEKASEIVDVATLTGGVIVALGFEATGVFTNTDSMYEKLAEASSDHGELVWRLPLFDEYKKLLKSNVADLINSPGRWASAATAAKFLEEFVENDTPWMHLDIAGTSFSTKAEDYYPKGATGKVVRTLYTYLKA